MSGRLFVVAGPSGVGKGTLISRALRSVPEVHGGDIRDHPPATLG